MTVPDAHLSSPKGISTTSSRLGPAIGAGVVVVVLFLWWLLTDATGTVPPLFFPGPADVYEFSGELSD